MLVFQSGFCSCRVVAYVSLNALVPVLKCHPDNGKINGQYDELFMEKLDKLVAQSTLSSPNQHARLCCDSTLTLPAHVKFFWCRLCIYFGCYAISSRWHTAVERYGGCQSKCAYCTLKNSAQCQRVVTLSLLCPQCRMVIGVFPIFPRSCPRLVRF